MLCRVISALLVSFLLVSCAMTRQVATPHDDITLSASNDVNPDPLGRAAPVIVKIYELSARTTFDYIDFDAAYSNAAVVLSDQLLSSREQVVLPRQSTSLRIELHENTEFIGIVAAYRDIDRAKWKLVYPVNSNWFQSHHVLLSESAAVLKQDNQQTMAD
jgi:type VI secretion system protein VasD